MTDIVVLYNRANTFGLAKDVEGIKEALAGFTLRMADPLEPPSPCDLAIHLEIPVYGWMPWAARNVLVVNPEWFQESWLPYMSRFDSVIYKNKLDMAEAVAKGYVAAEKATLVSWGCAEPISVKTVQNARGSIHTGFVWFLGGSVSKRAYVPMIVSKWHKNYPPLRIYSVAPIDLSGTPCPTNVRFEVKDLDDTTRIGLANFFRGHIGCSSAEGFSYPAAEAEWAGAFTILNDLNCFRADYSAQPGVHLISEEDTLDAAMQAFEQHNLEIISAKRKNNAAKRWASFKTGFSEAIKSVLSLKVTGQQLPPILTPEECPPISIVTLLYNRRKFFELACHSILLTDYPIEKIQWIIVEDSDDPAESASDRVVAAMNDAAAARNPLRIEYLPLKSKTSVAEKRNLGVAKATAEIVLMMDDDDHYPQTSFRRRVAWLTKHSWRPRAVAATTIACYDLVRGISAVNTPPMGLPLGQRISEATLTFYKDWWDVRGFPSAVQVGEAEGFVHGREHDLLEVPPQQIIVAFSHGKNVSSRRIPSGADVKPGCFWGFPKEFLVFIHGLAGIKVVSDATSEATSEAT
jgi:hypothetical protein